MQAWSSKECWEMRGVYNGGSTGGSPPAYFKTKLMLEGRKKNFWDPPPPSPSLPPPSCSGSGTGFTWNTPIHIQRTAIANNFLYSQENVSVIQISVNIRAWPWWHRSSSTKQNSITSPARTSCPAEVKQQRLVVLLFFISWIVTSLH